MADSYVANCLKILTYCRVRSVFKPARALPSTIIGSFRAISKNFKQKDTHE